MKYLVIPALLLLISSCSLMKVGGEDPSDPASEYVMSLKVAGTDDSGSKTDGATNKASGINDIYVLALKGNAVSYVAEGVDIDKITGKFQAKLIMSKDESDAYKIVLVANIKSFVDKQEGGKDFFKGKTYTQIQGLFVSDVLTTPILTDVESINRGFVLWGETKSAIVINSTTIIPTVQLLRSVARVDVGVGSPVNTNGNWTWNGMKNTPDGNVSSTPVPFVLENIYLFRPQNQYSYIPKMSADGNNTVFDHVGLRVSEHSAIGTNEVGNPWAYSSVTNPKYSTHQVYLPEAEVKIGNSAVSGDVNHTNRSAIVVGGKYNGNATSYYRIDFNNQFGLTNILRNHYYQFNIRNVLEDGYPDPESAYSARSMNMEVDVIDWSEGTDEEVIFDGLNWGSLQRRYMFLPGSKNISGSLTISSNIDADMWKMSLDGTTFVDTKNVENGLFKVTKPTNAENAAKKGVLVFESLTAITNGINKKSTLTVYIGDRIKFNILITQSPDGEVDWEEGGDFPHDF